jgi:hypothetical protein
MLYACIFLVFRVLPSFGESTTECVITVCYLNMSYKFICEEMQQVLQLNVSAAIQITKPNTF